MERIYRKVKERDGKILILRTIATGSSGNCHALIADNGEILLLDLGVPEKVIKKGIDWKISNVSGSVCSHVHKDHSLSVDKFEAMGIRVFAPYRGDCATLINSPWEIYTFDLTDLNGKWMHTNGDGSECPCYGFWIQHPEMGTLIYATDTELIKWRFKNINHILLGVNYDNDLISGDDAKLNHVVRGHMSIDTACDFVKANYSDGLQNVIMCHLSAENADKATFIEKMQKAAQNVNVRVAEPEMELKLRNPGECPF